MAFLHKRLIAGLLGVFLFVVSSQRSNAQTDSLSLDVTYPIVDHLSVGDIDFTTSTNQNDIFSVTIRSNTKVTTRVRLHLAVTINLSSGASYNLMNVRTIPIDIPKVGSRTIKDKDLKNNSPFRIDKAVQYFLDEAAKTKLQNLALASGKLPPGDYMFTIWLDNVAGQDITQAYPYSIKIQNITRVDLLSPEDESEVPTLFPVFQWNFEADSVVLSVFEKLPQHQSREDATHGTPSLVVRSGSALLPNDAHSIQYPLSAARALEEGKTYVWSVTGYTRGLSGGDGFNSELWQFSTASSSGNQQNRVTTSSQTSQILNIQTIANQLQSLPGINSTLLNQLLQSQYLPTGVLYNNGLPITLQELQKILNQLDIDPDMVLGIEIID